MPEARVLPWLVLAAGLAGCVEEGAEQDDRPSVVLVSIDTLRADRTSLLGCERETTPYLERLADESIVFEQAYTTSPWTLPAHASMLSGLYPEQHGVRTKGKALPEERVLLPEHLDRAGYETVGLYEPGWIHARHGFARGFDVFEGHEHLEQAMGHVGDVFAARDEAAPLFLFLHLFDVHSVPLAPDARWIYAPPAPYDRLFLEDAPDRFDAGEGHRIWYRTQEPSEAQLEALVALYDGGVRYVDDRLGELLEGWRASGFLDRALLVVTSDHGEALGTRGGEFTDHGALHQEGMRVPLLVRLPGAERGGERIDVPVSLVDLAPTVLGFLGLEHDGRLPGADLLAEVPARDRLVLGQAHTLTAIVRWPHKLVTANRAKAKGYLVELDGDAAGLSPIQADEDPERFNDVRRELYREYSELQELASWAPAEPAEAWRFSDEELERMRQLGYADEVR